MKGAPSFTLHVRKAFSCSVMRWDNSEEVQIKGESISGICIIAGFRSTGSRSAAAQPGHRTGGCSLHSPRAPARPGEKERLPTVPPREDSETCRGSCDTEAAGPGAGCWGTAPMPEGRELRRARTPPVCSSCVRVVRGRPPVPRRFLKLCCE